MNTISAGRAVVHALEAEGVSHVFGMPGGHVLGIYDAIYHSDKMNSVLVTHEHQAAAMAAGHAQLTGQVAVVVVTAGPGVTNALTAVTEAYVGALPMVVLAGRGATETVYRGASQEVDTHRVFDPVTKSAVRVDRADLLVPAVRQAFAMARGGKPGPVLIDIPRDVLGQQVESRPYFPAGPATRVVAESAHVEAAVAALVQAQRPIIVAGGGVIASGASDAVRELAETLATPVLTSLAGRGSVPEDHPLAVGGLGAHRNPVSKRLLGEADVVLGLGTRFEEMETNWRPGAIPHPDATYIQVDIDHAELGRSVPANIALVGDARTVAEQLLAGVIAAGEPSTVGYQAHPRVARVRDELDAVEAEVDTMAASEETPIHPVRVIRTARAVFPRKTTYGVDVGVLAQHIGGAFPYFRVFEPRSTIIPSSFYGMGFVTAAMPVARLVHPDRPALCFTGDGSFQMAMNVLPVATANRLPVTWAVLNDEALGSIWDIQHHVFGDRILDTEFSYQPDFVSVAAACGCHAARVDNPADVETALKQALAANNEGRPAVIDFRVARVRLAQTKEHYIATYPAEEEQA
ncbi:thiamine pyrophosphate-binding protein [Qaidamihabitans albus]|uniref:thiamine pyrophosphate-binding protein n=1 Tax=Qaidamihabitans albus TaxID=2795733 RepID=UPI0027DAC165|nr:thiamine pyrophosphate-binding protein [Qaidamihabitans albus]